MNRFVCLFFFSFCTPHEYIKMWWNVRTLFRAYVSNISDDMWHLQRDYYSSGVHSHPRSISSQTKIVTDRKLKYIEEKFHLESSAILEITRWNKFHLNYNERKNLNPPGEAEKIGIMKIERYNIDDWTVKKHRKIQFFQRIYGLNGQSMDWWMRLWVLTFA